MLLTKLYDREEKLLDAKRFAKTRAAETKIDERLQNVRRRIDQLEAAQWLEWEERYRFSHVVNNARKHSEEQEAPTKERVGSRAAKPARNSRSPSVWLRNGQPYQWKRGSQPARPARRAVIVVASMRMHQDAPPIHVRLTLGVNVESILVDLPDFQSLRAA